MRANFEEVHQRYGFQIEDIWSKIIIENKIVSKIC